MSKSSEPTLNMDTIRYPVVKEVAGKMEIIEDSFNILWYDRPSIRNIKAQEQGTKANHLPK